MPLKSRFYRVSKVIGGDSGTVGATAEEAATLFDVDLAVVNAVWLAQIYYKGGAKAAVQITIEGDELVITSPSDEFEPRFDKEAVNAKSKLGGLPREIIPPTMI